MLHLNIHHCWVPVLYITDYQSIWTIFFKSQEWYYLLIGCYSSLCKHVTLVNVSLTRTRVIIQIGRALLVKLCWMHDERWISLDRKGCFYSQYFFISYLPTYSSSESPCDKISVIYRSSITQQQPTSLLLTLHGVCNESIICNILGYDLAHPK